MESNTTHADAARRGEHRRPSVGAREVGGAEPGAAAGSHLDASSKLSP